MTAYNDNERFETMKLYFENITIPFYRIPTEARNLYDKIKEKHPSHHILTYPIWIENPTYNTREIFYREMEGKDDIILNICDRIYFESNTYRIPYNYCSRREVLEFVMKKFEKSSLFDKDISILGLIKTSPNKYLVCVSRKQ